MTKSITSFIIKKFILSFSISMFIGAVTYATTVVDTSSVHAGEDASVSSKSSSKKKLTATEMPLYHLLGFINKNVQETLQELLHETDPEIQEQNSESQKILAAAAKLSQDAQELLVEIIDDLNSNRFLYNPEIEYRFIKICTLHRDRAPEDIKPRHIRDLSKHLKDFNHYITFFCLQRKGFLGKDDLEFFNRMTRFNHILMYGILNEEYLNIGFLDTATDLIIYRPWEFACEHKVLTAVVATAICAGVGYYFWNKYHREKIENPYGMFQYQSPEQKELDCGEFSLINTLLVKAANGNTVLAQEYLNKFRNNPSIVLDPLKKRVIERRNFLRDTAAPEISARERKALARRAENANMLNKEEIEMLMNEKNLMKEVLGKIIPEHCISDDLYQDIIVLDPATEGRYVEGEYYPGNLLEQGIDNFDRELLNISFGDFLRSLDRFKQDKHSQSVILRINNHWLVVGLQHDELHPMGVRTHIIDSFKNKNRFTSKSVMKLVDLYKPEKPVEKEASEKK